LSDRQSVFAEISTYVSPGRTIQYGGRWRTAACGDRSRGRCTPPVRGISAITRAMATATLASAAGARKRPIRPRRRGTGAYATISARPGCRC
jgi:hypothetical protein